MRRIEAFRGNDLAILNKNMEYYRERLPEGVPISVSLTITPDGVREALVIFELPDKKEALE